MGQETGAKRRGEFGLKCGSIIIRSELRKRPLLRRVLTLMNARQRPRLARHYPNVLPGEQPLEAQLSNTIAQNGVKREFRPLCVFGVARYRCTARMHYAAYTSSLPLQIVVGASRS